MQNTPTPTPESGEAQALVDLVESGVKKSLTKSDGSMEFDAASATANILKGIGAVLQEQDADAQREKGKEHKQQADEQELAEKESSLPSIEAQIESSDNA